jgi:hypothetical protein
MSGRNELERRRQKKRILNQWTSMKKMLNNQIRNSNQKRETLTQIKVLALKRRMKEDQPKMKSRSIISIRIIRVLINQIGMQSHMKSYPRLEAQDEAEALQTYDQISIGSIDYALAQ